MKSVWNGLNWQDTAFGGPLVDALESYRAEVEDYGPYNRDKMTPTDDWLVVAVDYHD